MASSFSATSVLTHAVGNEEELTTAPLVSSAREPMRVEHFSIPLDEGERQMRRLMQGASRSRARSRNPCSAKDGQQRAFGHRHEPHVRTVPVHDRFGQLWRAVSARRGAHPLHADFRRWAALEPSGVREPGGADPVHKSRLAWVNSGWQSAEGRDVYVMGICRPLREIHDRYGNVTWLTWLSTDSAGSGCSRRGLTSGV
jgi:hypothetical protein